MGTKNYRIKRKKRIRKKIFGNKDRPRLSVFRSNKHIYAQVVNDVDGDTIASMGDLNLSKKSGTKTEIAKEVGRKLGGKLKKEKILKVVFDRSGYKYHGRLKALAEEVRKIGIEF